jgi:aspartate-semialdehyde dehydrogenase
LAQGYCVGILGAGGSVANEILAVLGDRRFPVSELRAFGSERSEGGNVELLDHDATIERPSEARLATCDVVFAAAPGLAGLLPWLAGTGTRLIDLSGTLEADPSVPLYLAGFRPHLPGRGREPWLAIPRGVASGLGLALGPLAQSAPLVRVSVCTLESASAAGHRGVDVLSTQTVELLNAMSGDLDEIAPFPRSLAFDCLPQVGELYESGDTAGEMSLRAVLRRLLDAPGLRVEVTRVWVPVFMGALACVHVESAAALSTAHALAAWALPEGVRVVHERSWPTLRSAVADGDVLVGRVRAGDAGDTTLGFVVALDNLRRGAALGAVQAAEAFVAS